MFQGLILLVPEKQDPERDAVCSEWCRHGGSIVKLGRFWEPPALDRRAVRLYGPDTFCLVLAQKLKLSLLSPADTILAKLDSRWLKRTVRDDTLSSAANLKFPLFVKPAVPKVFRAAIYESAEALRAECRGLDDDTAILTSDPVNLIAEARAFILNGEVKSCAIYDGQGNVGDAALVAKEVAASYDFPETFVIDMGFIAGSGWAVIEFNATWGAGLNNCDALAVASCLRHATQLKRDS